MKLSILPSVICFLFVFLFIFIRLFVKTFCFSEVPLHYGLRKKLKTIHGSPCIFTCCNDHNRSELIFFQKNCLISEVDDSISDVGSLPSPSAAQSPSAEDGENVYFPNADGDETLSESSTLSRSDTPHRKEVTHPTKRPLEKREVRKIKKKRVQTLF